MLSRPPRILGKTISRLLVSYYFGPDHPSKVRIWDLCNKWFGFPRLLVPHGERGWISVDFRDVLQFWLVRDRYNDEVWETLSRYASRDEVVWDIGGHIGMVSVHAMQDPKVREVHAFEAHPVIFQALKANLALNPGFRATAHSFGLGDKAGTLELHESLPNNSGLGSFIPTGGIYPSHLVPVRTVDEVIADGVPAPTLIKLDVEGWELPVLKGATKLLTETPPKAIYFEAECDAMGKITDPRMGEWLDKFGYRYEFVPPKSGVISQRENYLAVPRTQAR